jgi:hypothetical protein
MAVLLSSSPTKDSLRPFDFTRRKDDSLAGKGIISQARPGTLALIPICGADRPLSCLEDSTQVKLPRWGQPLLWSPDGTRLIRYVGPGFLIHGCGIRYGANRSDGGKPTPIGQTSN